MSLISVIKSKTLKAIISAAAVGVEARLSATKSAIVKSVSCPMAETKHVSC